MRRAELLRHALPAIAWSAAILVVSGGTGSSMNTAALLRIVLNATVGGVSDTTFEILHLLVRKSGHVLAYAIAGALNFRAVRHGRPGWAFRWSAAAVVLAVAVAAADEWHQSFFHSRTGVPADVMIDFCGAVLAQVLSKQTADGGRQKAGASRRAEAGTPNAS